MIICIDVLYALYVNVSRRLRMVTLAMRCIVRLLRVCIEPMMGWVCDHRRTRLRNCQSRARGRCRGSPIYGAQSPRWQPCAVHPRYFVRRHSEADSHPLPERGGYWIWAIGYWQLGSGRRCGRWHPRVRSPAPRAGLLLRWSQYPPTYL